MATSGSYNFNLTRNETITFALRKLGVLAKGQPASAEQITDASIDLNAMLKQWRARGISLPLYQELTVYLEEGKQSYLIGPTGDEVTATPYKTEVATAASSGASSIVVDSASSFTNGDNIGVVQDNNTILWTTGTKSSNTITLGTTLTSTVAVDNHVYFYTSIAQRPVKVVSARLRREDNTEIPIRVVTREEYFNYSNKFNTGKINAVYYDPQLNNGVLYTYLTADSVSDLLLLTVQRQIQDMDSSNDNLDLPQEWLLPVGYNLAYLIGDDYGVDEVTMANIKAKAEQFYLEVESSDQEDSIQFTPGLEE